MRRQRRMLLSQYASNCFSCPNWHFIQALAISPLWAWGVCVCAGVCKQLYGVMLASNGISGQGDLLWKMAIFTGRRTVHFVSECLGVLSTSLLLRMCFKRIY